MRVLIGQQYHMIAGVRATLVLIEGAQRCCKSSNSPTLASAVSSTIHFQEMVSECAALTCGTMS